MPQTPGPSELHSGSTRSGSAAGPAGAPLPDGGCGTASQTADRSVERVPGGGQWAPA